MNIQTNNVNVFRKGTQSDIETRIMLIVKKTISTLKNKAKQKLQIDGLMPKDT